MRSTVVVVVALLVARAGGVAAQEDPHAACTAPGWVPGEILERPVALRTGTGNARETVSTCSKEAQAFYLQGLDYLHGYVWIEAARSFRQALRHDPDLAMAWVGLSRVHSGLDDPESALKALARARELAEEASPRERRRIELRAKQLEAMADLGAPALHAAYKKALDHALAVDLTDPELWLIRGNAEEPSAAGRGQRGGAASTAFYLEALRLQPDNAAAHHYLTHSYETIGHIDRALVHGEAFARLAPAIPHAHHMWGHDLRRVGRIDEAIAAFKKADELERAYFAAEGIAPELDWHHLHNLDLLSTCYQHKGQMRLAEATMRQVGALAPVTAYAEFHQRAWPLFLLARNRPEEALEAARGMASGRWPAGRAMGQVLVGHALAALGRLDEARAALVAAKTEAGGMTAVLKGLVPSRAAVEPHMALLEGELLLRLGKAEEGRALLEQSSRALRATPGPDAWIQALFRLEHVARLAQAAGDWRLAEVAAEQMMEHDSAYAGSHLAYARVARHQGKAALADELLASARRYWRDADPELPELKELLAAGASASAR